MIPYSVADCESIIADVQDEIRTLHPGSDSHVRVRLLQELDHWRDMLSLSRAAEFAGKNLLIKEIQKQARWD